jgi:hypothetical protein
MLGYKETAEAQSCQKGLKGFSKLSPNCKNLMANYRFILISNSLFASSIYAYNSPNPMVNMLYYPGLLLTFITYKVTGTYLNNLIRLVPKEKFVYNNTPLYAFMAFNILFPFKIQKFWGKDYHQTVYEEYLTDAR